MKLFLNRQQAESLRKKYKYSNGREKQLAQVVLLCSEGWSQSKIAKALNLDEQTVLDYLQEYLKPKPPLRKSLHKYTLTPDQTAEFVAHIEKNPRISMRNMIEYIKQNYKETWNEPAIQQFLKKNGFLYVNEPVLHGEAITRRGEKRPIYKYFRGWFRNTSIKSNNCTSCAASTHKAG